MGSDTHSIKVFGTTYPEVRGYTPFYLAIPERNLLLFVTGRDENGRGNAIVHLADLKTRAVKSFPAHDSHIGRGIRPEGNDGKWDKFERVELVDGNRLVVHAGFMGVRRYRYYLDLAKPEFEKEEGVVPDPVFLSRTNTYVWPHGKAPRN